MACGARDGMRAHREMAPIARAIIKAAAIFMVLSSSSEMVPSEDPLNL